MRLSIESITIAINSKRLVMDVTTLFFDMSYSIVLEATLVYIEFLSSCFILMRAKNM